MSLHVREAQPGSTVRSRSGLCHTASLPPVCVRPFFGRRGWRRVGWRRCVNGVCMESVGGCLGAALSLSWRCCRHGSGSRTVQRAFTANEAHGGRHDGAWTVRRRLDRVQLLGARLPL